jgi:hypothetical protein
MLILSYDYSLVCIDIQTLFHDVKFCVLYRFYRFRVIHYLNVQLDFVSHLFFECVFIVVWKLRIKVFDKNTRCEFSLVLRKSWRCAHQVFEFDTIIIKPFHIICASIGISLTHKPKLFWKVLICDLID